jgi:hypothetical protein
MYLTNHIEQSRRHLKRAANEDFVSPSSKEDLMNHVLQELHEEVDDGDDKDDLATALKGNSFPSQLEMVCHLSMPCDTQQKFQAIVQQCRDLLVAFCQDLNRATKIATDKATKTEKKKNLGGSSHGSGGRKYSNDVAQRHDRF